MKFHCTACKDYKEKEHPSYSEFQFSGYDDCVVLWSDESTSKPAVNENGLWLRSETTPCVHDQRVVYLSHPFSEANGDSFWSLYTPALSSFNGWEEHPEEIDYSAFVRCSITKVIEQNEVSAWVIVDVLEVIRFGAIAETLPVRQDEQNFIEKIYRIEPGNFTSFENWIIFDSFDQGSTGHSILIRIEDPEIFHLVCYTETSIHCSSAFVGNVVVEKEFVNELRARSKSTA